MFQIVILSLQKRNKWIFFHFWQPKILLKSKFGFLKFLIWDIAIKLKFIFGGKFKCGQENLTFKKIRLYRIINYTPKPPSISIPRLSIPDFNVYWRRFKYHISRKRWLFAATSCGLMATLTGMGHYFYTHHYLQRDLWISY